MVSRFRVVDTADGGTTTYHLVDVLVDGGGPTLCGLLPGTLRGGPGEGWETIGWQSRCPRCWSEREAAATTAVNSAEERAAVAYRLADQHPDLALVWLVNLVRVCAIGLAAAAGEPPTLQQIEQVARGRIAQWRRRHPASA